MPLGAARQGTVAQLFVGAAASLGFILGVYLLVSFRIPPLEGAGMASRALPVDARSRVAPSPPARSKTAITASPLLRGHEAVEAVRVSDAVGSDDPNVRTHAALCDALAECGFAVAPAFLARGEVAALRAQAERRRAAGELHAARVGRGASVQRDSAIRGDAICWLDAASATAVERALLSRLDSLRLALNRELFLGLEEIEAHYARYEPGTHYARHVDRFRDDDARVVSLVLYLNETWGDEDGGELRLFPNAEASAPALTVAPRAGTLVAMRSDTIAHEVAPAQRERWSIAAWLRRRG